MARQQIEGEKRGPGRPPGEESPEILIRRELISHLKLYRRCREAIQKRLDGGGVDTLGAEEIGKFMELLRKGINDLGRSVIATPKATGEKVTEEQSGEELLREMLEGRERG